MRKTVFFNSTNILVGLRFIARLMVIGIIIMMVTIYFSEPSSHNSLNPFGLGPGESLLTFSFYAAIIGLLLAWRMEGFGGFLTLSALIIFSLIYYYLKSEILWNIWIMGVPAFLFIVCWWFTNYSTDYDVYRK